MNLKQYYVAIQQNLVAEARKTADTAARKRAACGHALSWHGKSGKPMPLESLTIRSFDDIERVFDLLELRRQLNRIAKSAIASASLGHELPRPALRTGREFADLCEAMRSASHALGVPFSG